MKPDEERLISLKFQRAKLIAEERKKKNEALGINCDQSGHPFPGQNDRIDNYMDPDEIISDEQRAEEMKERSCLSEVKQIFSLRDEK